MYVFVFMQLELQYLHSRWQLCKYDKFKNATNRNFKRILTALFFECVNNSHRFKIVSKCEIEMSEIVYTYKLEVFFKKKLACYIKISIFNTSKTSGFNPKSQNIYAIKI